MTTFNVHVRVTVPDEHRPQLVEVVRLYLERRGLSFVRDLWKDATVEARTE